MPPPIVRTDASSPYSLALASTRTYTVNEVQRLSGGHALVAFGWALIEKNQIRAKLDIRTVS